MVDISSHLAAQLVAEPCRPSVPLNAQNAILACLVDMLSAVAEHNLSRERTSRWKRKRRAAQAIVASKKSRILVELEPRSTTVDAPLATHEGDINNAAEAATVTPPILRSLAAGINEVTKRLETIARSHRHMVNSDIDKDGETAQGSIATSRDRLVVVCRADVDPPALVSHIPNLVATCNSRREGGGRTWLISLPKGAEHTLAEALGLRRAAAMLIEVRAAYFWSFIVLSEDSGSRILLTGDRADAPERTSSSRPLAGVAAFRPIHDTGSYTHQAASDYSSEGHEKCEGTSRPWTCRRQATPQS